MNCRSCKAAVRPGARFCANCGRKISAITLAQPVNSSSIQAEAQPVKPRAISLRLGPLNQQRRSFLPVILVFLALGALAVGGNYLFGPYSGYTLDYSTPQATVRTWAAAVKAANPK